MNHLVKLLENPAIIALLVLGAMAIFFFIKNYHESKLINKAGVILNIHMDYVHMFRVELLSLYKHQPQLKDISDYVDFRQLVATNDSDLLDKIYKKDQCLWEHRLEYGEEFSNYAHHI